MKSYAWAALAVAGACAMPVLLPRLMAEEAPAAPPVSSYAPADELSAQVEYFSKRLEDSLADDDYTDAEKSRVKKDANTLAVLALAIQLHDENPEGKAQAPSKLAAAQELAAASDDLAAARAAFEKFKAGDQAADGAAATEWTKVASLGQLMKQVPLLNNTLKRGMDARRFKRNADENAGLAVSLAVIAQASMVDTHEVKDPALLPQWYEYCAQMRDAAASVRTAIRADDQPAAMASMKAMAESCDRCHEAFRVE